jgi:hypothetical protein
VERATADSSHVHLTSIGQVGGQLYPDSIATPTPQTFSMASPPTASLGFGVDLSVIDQQVTRCTPARIHQVGAGTLLTELLPLVHSRSAF